MNEIFIKTGRENSLDEVVPNMLREGQSISKTEVFPGQFSASPKIDAEGIAKQNIMETSMRFEDTRADFRDLLHAIIQHAVRRFEINTETGVDIGCGPSGEMVEQLMRPLIPNPGGWAQIDINPAAVKENKRRHPHSAIYQGSYLHLTKELNLRDKLNLITGLSSLDSTTFIEQAITEIRDSLRKNGFFLHVQDVRPGAAVVIQELMRMGLNPPFKGETLNLLPKNGIDMVTYETPEETLSVGELFRRAIGRAIKGTEGMDLIFNDWITARKKIEGKSRAARLYYMNMDLFDPYRALQNDFASAVVTVARKVA